MAVDFISLSKTFGIRLLSLAGAFLKGQFAKWSVRKRAIEGEDLSSLASLENMVKAQLVRLAASSALPKELQNDSFRAWLLTEECLERFIEVLIAKAGGDPALSQRAYDDLAGRYELATGETRKLATGPLNLVVSYVYGQLRATEPDRQAFDSAIALRNAAQLFDLRHPDLRTFPTDADLERLWIVSARLLEAGRASWKMPAFVAPLTLETHEDKNDEETRPITPLQLVEAIADGENLILSGDGGIGKTTLLLELASLCTQEAARRAPLYIDAAIWARSGVGVLDYLASLPPAQALGVTSGDLAKFALRGSLVLLVNGWNEIPSERKSFCRETFNILTSTAPALAVAIASRTAQDTASLHSPRRIIVRGLTWKGQSRVIRSELSEGSAEALLEVLAIDTRLRHAARSPLILRGLIAQAEEGAQTPSNVYDILGAVVAALEREDRRQLALADAPVFGMQTRYLEELACSLNASGATNLAREEALSAIGTAAAHMAERRLLGVIPPPSAVLDALASHHVLHIQGGMVRFAHQRFQEYFGAAHLLRFGVVSEDSIARLRDAVNEPAWADSVALLAGKLKAPEGSCEARALLVQTAEAIDLAYACELAGLCAFAEKDDSTLHDRLVSRVNELGASPLSEAMDLATVCRIASRLPAFAETLWVLFESDDQQTRLHSFNLYASGISLSQLGPHAAARINAWPASRRAELLREIAKNSDNYDFIVRAATTDRASDVRAAAIAALFWNYPASTAGINAWLNAPLEIQTRHDLVDHIGYVFDQEVDGDQIREKVRVIGAGEISDTARLQLALAFPAEAGPGAVDIVLARLRSEEQRGSPERLISIAQAYAPDRLLALAIELIAGHQGTPQWVGELLLAQTQDTRKTAFEAAWEALMTGEGRRLRMEIVGPLSSKDQTRRSVAAWLRHCDQRRCILSDAEQERGRKIGYLLAQTPGDDLLDVIMELGIPASYAESVELAELLLTRVSPDVGNYSSVNLWMPLPKQFKQLFDLFSGKCEEARDPHERLFTLLACIASHVAPADFGSVLLEALRRNLDAWTTYRAILNTWILQPSLPRPNNPSMGNYVISALARWGMDALPGVLQALSHPNALELVPQAVGRIVSIPWTDTKKQAFSSVNTDIQDGLQRRVAGCILQQPSNAYQPVTDDAARALASLLNIEVESQLTERMANPKWNVRQCESKIGNLVGILASLPSAEIVAPVTRALGSGLLGLYGFVDALRALTRQGWVLSDAGVVAELEALYARETSAAWIDESKRYKLAECSQLMFIVEPPTRLKLPLSHYLHQWQLFDRPSEVVRAIGDMKTERAWPVLLALRTELSTTGNTLEEFPCSLASALSSNHFAEFARLIADGTLFAWCNSSWTVERIAPAVSEVVKNAPEHLASLIDSCRKSGSPLGDALLLEVLTRLDVVDEMRLELGLEALDAGRANNPNMPAYRMLMRMFQMRAPIGNNQFEVYPKSCNLLRRQLYRRAKLDGGAALAARRILASLECSRREGDRPTDEPRHPSPNDGLPWTHALLLSDVAPSQLGGAS